MGAMDGIRYGSRGGLVRRRATEYETDPGDIRFRAPKDAEAMFDVLTYEKGRRSCISNNIGPTVFRDGVRHYLTTHAYGNAETTDLWLSLGQAAKQDVPGLMNNWIFRPATRWCRCNWTGLRTHHQPTAIPLPSRRRRSSSWDAERWQIPVQLKITTETGTETVACS
ncbi:MAG: M1 family aminopeptidase [Nitrospiraceae bacterium]